MTILSWPVFAAVVLTLAVLWGVSVWATWQEQHTIEKVTKRVTVIERRIGPTGPRGVQGVTGARGEPGKQGVPGKVRRITVYVGGRKVIAYVPLREPGLTGARGARGRRGPAGARGARGAQGLQGRVGARGPKGEGERGLPGPPGPAGAQGPPGPVGSTTCPTGSMLTKVLMLAVKVVVPPVADGHLLAWVCVLPS